MNLNILEEVRIQSIQQHRYMAVLERPFVPEKAERPRRLVQVATLCLLGLLAFAIVRLLLVTIREHQMS